MTKRFLILITALLLHSAVTAQGIEQVLQNKAVPFEDRTELTALADLVTTERLVLMGEASHGTAEFYTKRAIMSKHLVDNHGFNFIAVEGDWSSFSRINEYVKHKERGPQTIDEAMASITRWPLWMWRNHEFQTLVEWLRDFNENLPEEERVGLYGIDVYDNYAAMDDVVAWIQSVDSEQGDRADRLYSCMSRHPQPGDYIRMVAQTNQDCSEDIAEVLEIVRSLENHPDADRWGFFNAEQGAKVAINAELHYRANLQQGPQSWNYRANHFYLTAERLLGFYGEESRGIVWAHNTHIGDARATDMGNFNMQNIGQLSRDALGRNNVFAIGFGTYTGEVLAAREWEGRMRTMRIPQAGSGTWEYLLEQTSHPAFYLDLSDVELASFLDNRFPHRAIGVTYNPANEQNNFVPSNIPERYDAFIFIRETGILQPLD